MPRARAPSVPGRMGIHSAPTSRAVWLRCGSMQMTSAPRSTAFLISSWLSGGESVAGFAPQITISSAFSIS